MVQNTNTWKILLFDFVICHLSFDFVICHLKSQLPNRRITMFWFCGVLDWRFPFNLTGAYTFNLTGAYNLNFRLTWPEYNLTGWYRRRQKICPWTGFWVSKSISTAAEQKSSLRQKRGFWVSKSISTAAKQKSSLL